MDTPAVTVVVPTRGRSAYLEVTLDSLLRQRSRTPHEILVVDDGATDATREVAARAGVRCVSHGGRRSLNAARNTGIRECEAPIVAFVDDDVQVPPRWLDALVRGAERNPDAEAFGGPIRARFEGGGPPGDGGKGLDRPRGAGGGTVSRGPGGLPPRRTAADSRLAVLARSAYARGR